MNGEGSDDGSGDNDGDNSNLESKIYDWIFSKSSDASEEERAFAPSDGEIAAELVAQIPITLGEVTADLGVGAADGATPDFIIDPQDYYTPYNQQTYATGETIGNMAVTGGFTGAGSLRYAGVKAASNVKSARTAMNVVESAFPPGSVGAAKVWSISARLKVAQLPTTGKIRFVPPNGYKASNPLNRGNQNGYIDKFGNEWVRGPSRTRGDAFEWDVQLSNTGKEKLGWASPDGRHLNVSLGGHITH